MGSKGLRTIQDLDLCFLTHAQHEDLVWWIQVESYIVPDLLDEEWVMGNAYRSRSYALGHDPALQ